MGLEKLGLRLSPLFLYHRVSWPDLPDLALKLLKVENVTTMNLPGASGEVVVKVYSPKLLLIGQTDVIDTETFGPEEPEFKVTADSPSDVVVIEREKGVFEIKCKGTDVDLLSSMRRSEPVILSIDASVPAGTASTTIVVKTSYLLSLIVRLGILLSSGGVGVKKLWTWLQGGGKGEPMPHSS